MTKPRTIHASGGTRFPRGPHYMPVMPEAVTACRRLVEPASGRTLLVARQGGTVTCARCLAVIVQATTPGEDCGLSVPAYNAACAALAKLGA